jgi:hypothetical protein
MRRLMSAVQNVNSLGNVIFNSSVTSMKLKIKSNQSTRLHTIDD